MPTLSATAQTPDGDLAGYLSGQRLLVIDPSPPGLFSGRDFRLDIYASGALGMTFELDEDVIPIDRWRIDAEGLLCLQTFAVIGGHVLMPVLGEACIDVKVDHSQISLTFGILEYTATMTPM